MLALKWSRFERAERGCGGGTAPDRWSLDESKRRPKAGSEFTFFLAPFFAVGLLRAQNVACAPIRTLASCVPTRERINVANRDARAAGRRFGSEGKSPVPL